MNSGYFATYSRVIGQTAGYTEERDYLEELLARAKFQDGNTNAVNFTPDTPKGIVKTGEK